MTAPAVLSPQIGWVKEPKLTFTRSQFQRLPPEQREKARELLAQHRETVAINPLYGVWLRALVHHDYMSCKSFIGAMFGGNRSAKSSTMVLNAIVNCIPLDWVPPHLLQYRTYLDDQPFYARIGVPTLDKHAVGVMLPLLRRWVPQGTLNGGKFETAWSNKHNQLTFKNGSFIEFRSYDQDTAAWAGSSRHAIYLDEQPKFDQYQECLLRLAEYEGAFMRFALTPLGLSWVYSEIYKQRNDVKPYNAGADDSLDIEVFYASIHDNDTISEVNKKLALAGTRGAMREAREFGKFVSMEGRVYDAFQMRHHVVPDIVPEYLADGQIYIGIDPGLRYPAAVFVLANSLKEEVLVFDEVRTSAKIRTSAESFCRLIKEKQRRWGIVNPTYIIDPAARIPGMTDNQDLLTEYARHGISAGVPNTRDVETGIERVRGLLGDPDGDPPTRVHLFICEKCTQLQDEFEIWSFKKNAGDELGEGKATYMDSNNHGTDAVRFVSLCLPWEPKHDDPIDKPPADSIAAMLKNQPPDDLEWVA